MVKVFRDSGRAVPTFSDKHLSWNWEWARKMYDTSRELQFSVHGGVEPAGDVAHAVGRDAAGLAHQRGDVRVLRRRGQLRFSRPGNRPVHGGAAARRRDRRAVDPGLSRREILGGAARGRLAQGADGCRALPQSHAGAGAGGLQRRLSHAWTTCGGWCEIRWRTAISTPTG